MAADDFLMLIKEENRARLFPVGKDTNKERGITSIFLACLSVVKGYSSGVLSTVGKKVGTLTSLECYTEIIIPKQKGNDRPDGLILLRKGKKVIWTALIEAKVGTAELNEEQILRYLTLAKEYKIDALITISNQFSALPTHHPIKVPKTLTRSVDLFHWSWTYLRTQADYQLRVEDEIDIDQKYILSEMVRYFSDPSSGVLDFHSMNSEWKDICLSVKRKENLKKNSEEILNTISAWHQEQRDIVLKLTSELGRGVNIKLSKVHKGDQEQRLKSDSAELCDQKTLSCEILIPDAASPVLLVVDVAHRTVECSMELIAPSDKQSTKARVNWLLRQLSNVEDESVSIQAKWPGATKPTQKALSILREDPTILQSDNPKQVPGWLTVKTTVDLAGRFSGRKTFIEDLENSIEYFYSHIGQSLKPYQPPAPKMLNRETNMEDTTSVPEQ